MPAITETGRSAQFCLGLDRNKIWPAAYRHERPGAWALLKDRLDELFPHTFTYRFESGASAELPLFGDLVKSGA